MSSGPHDLTLAIRRLRREPGFALTALATLALTIGATTAIFAVVNAVLLRPLPFAESDRVVEIFNSYPNAGAGKGDSSVPNYFDRQGALPALSDLAMYKSRGMTLGGQGSAERVPGFQVTTSFFDLIRTPAYRGRLFLPEDGEVGNPPQGDPEPRSVAAALCGTRERPGSGPEGQWRADDGDRRHAAGLPVRRGRRRAVDSGGLHARGSRRRPPPQQQLDDDRSPAAGRLRSCRCKSSSTRSTPGCSISSRT